MKLVSRILGRVLAGALLLVFVLILIIWALSPLISRTVIGDVLEQQGLKLDEKSSIRLNPFSSRLTIHDLAWESERGRVFKLEQLRLSYSLWRLTQSEIIINELIVKGVDAVVAQREDALEVLGFAVGAAEEDAPEQAAEDSTELESDSASLSINAQLHRLEFQDIELDLSVDGQKQLLNIKQLELSDVAFDGINLSAEIAAELSINDNKFDADGKLNDDVVKGVIPEVALDLGMSAQVQAAIDEEIGLKLENLQLDLAQIHYFDGVYRAKLGKFSFASPSVDLVVAEALSVAAEVSLSLTAMDVKQGTSGNTLMALDTFSVPSVNAVLDKDQVSLSIPETRLVEAVFLSPEGKTALAKFTTLDLDTLSLSHNLATGGSEMTLDAVALGGLYADIKLNKNAEIEELSLLATEDEPVQKSTDAIEGAQQDNEKSEVLEEQDEPTPAFAFQIAKFELSSAADILVDDQSVDPVFSKHFVIDKLAVENIDNQKPEESLDFELLLKDSEFFSYQLSGNAKPFKDKLNLNLSSGIKEFAVHEVSPYLNTSLGFGVQAGQLDSDADIAIVDDILDGEVKLNLRGAKFTSNKAKQEDELDMIGQAAIPLNVALGMLKDGDGNIKLTIPVDGDVNDPKFGVQYIVGLVVKKAVMSQTKKYLINTFVPYGQVLSVAYSAGSYALKVRFEDLIYQKSQVEMGEAETLYAQQFAELLAKKDDLQVRVCPVATADDLVENQGKAALSDEQKQQLVVLATERGVQFKRSVIELGIDSSRLLLCSPEIDLDSDAQPRIEFSI